VVNSTIADLEALKVLDVESVPDGETEAAKAIRLKNKLIINNNTQM